MVIAGLGLGLVAVFVVATVWACYPKRVGPAGPDGERLAWTAMNKDQRKAHMRNVVLPRAADVFQAWRPERCVRVDCTLCHGDEGLLMLKYFHSHLGRQKRKGTFTFE